MKTLRSATTEQLSGSRPSILCAKLESLTADDLVEIASGPNGGPSALHVEVN